MPADWLAGGVVADVILALIAGEALVLFVIRKFWGRGLAAASIAANLFSGAFLILALRSALTGTDAKFISLCLAGALVAHISDLVLRWQ